MKLRIWCLTILAVVTIGTTGAQEHEHPPAHGHPEPTHEEQSAVERLSPAVRALLRDEMVALEEAMQALVPAVVSGDAESVEHLASQMRDSYVLSAALTEAQRAELERTLPPGFLERDLAFHQLAADLATAARDSSETLVPFYVYKLTESCVTCHARYAAHRFPAFAQAPARGHHHH